MYFPWGDSMIMVNREGNRVVNEKSPYMDRTYAHFQFDATTKTYSNQALFMIYDSVVASEEEPEGWRKIRRPVPPVGEFPEYQILGETWEELAEGIEAQLEKMASHVAGLRLSENFVANLKDTIGTFNSYAEEGYDPDFRRGEAPHDRNYSAKMRLELKNHTMSPFAEEGPYCAIIIGPACFDTCGGPRINSNGQIIDINDKPIVGLYGAGNCVASPAGQAYWSGGTTLGCGLIFGYLAGANAAAKSS